MNGTHGKTTTRNFKCHFQFILCMGRIPFHETQAKTILIKYWFSLLSHSPCSTCQFTNSLEWSADSYEFANLPMMANKRELTKIESTRSILCEWEKFISIEHSYSHPLKRNFEKKLNFQFFHNVFLCISLNCSKKSTYARMVCTEPGSLTITGSFKKQSVDPDFKVRIYSY